MKILEDEMNDTMGNNFANYKGLMLFTKNNTAGHGCVRLIDMRYNE